MKPSLDRSVVLHSSHQQIIVDPVPSSNPLLSLPTTPGAGLILRTGIHPRLHVPVYDLYTETPTLTSPGVVGVYRCSRRQADSGLRFRVLGIVYIW